MGKELCQFYKQGEGRRTTAPYASRQPDGFGLTVNGEYPVKVAGWHRAVARKGPFDPFDLSAVKSNGAADVAGVR